MASPMLKSNNNKKSASQKSYGGLVTNSKHFPWPQRKKKP